MRVNRTPIKAHRRNPPRGRVILSPSKAEDEARFIFRDEEIPHPSRILRRFSEPGWELGQLWREMRQKNLHLGALWKNRVKAYMGLPTFILPANAMPEAEFAAEFCKLILEHVPNFHINREHQMTARADGWAADAIKWQPILAGELAGAWGLDLIDQDMSRFAYLRRGSRLAQRKANGKFRVIHPDNVIVCVEGSKANPWGGDGLMADVWWYYFAADRGWEYYLTFLEQFASPTKFGQYSARSPNAAQDAAILRDALQSFQADHDVVLPDDVVISLLESTRGGDSSYHRFIEVIHHAMALMLHGQAGTTGLEQGGNSHGSRAKLTVLYDVRLDIVRDDCLCMDTHWRRSLLSKIVRYNLGEDWPVPLWVTEVESAEDLHMRQERMDSILDRGIPQPLDLYLRTNRGRMPREGERILSLSEEGRLTVREFEGESDALFLPSVDSAAPERRENVLTLSRAIDATLQKERAILTNRSNLDRYLLRAA